MEAQKSLSRDARDFWVPLNKIEYVKCPSLEDPLSILQFYRKFVARNVPVVIKGGIDHWPALEKWDQFYLRSKMCDAEVTVALTPDGRGDCIQEGSFVLPFEQKMCFQDALDIMEERPMDKVIYMQSQNDCFSREFAVLIDDIEIQLPWATEMLGIPPDAVNMWIGDDRSVSSLHKDPYENFYTVVRGRKHFLLHPPVDYPFLYPKKVNQTQYILESGHWKRIPVEAPQIEWISVDPLQLDTFPLYKHTLPLRVTLNPGDMLYLPSLWFHEVSQDNFTVAVNFWYDMDFGPNHCYFEYLKASSLCQSSLES